MRACLGDAGFVLNGDDCDDTTAARNPGQREVCDAVDNDCDDDVDEDTGPAVWYRDADGDGFGAASSGTTTSCTAPTGHVLLGSDCDDAARGRSPAALEACNGVDDDCNGRADFRVGAADTEDDDGDGHPDLGCPRGDDCDDADAATYGGAVEICDLRDNDCDGAVDGPAAVPARFRRDVDGDGWGDPADAGLDTCDPPPGTVATTGDCDDSAAWVRPGATDGCGRGDEDCDTRIDEDGTAPLVFHADGDGDGYGAVGGATMVGCTAPASFGPAGDCDDADAGVHPAAAELCNLRDDDCDGTIDPLPEASLTCALPGVATAACDRGTCRVATCDAGRGDCDRADGNGCEIDVATTPAHCGACAMVCAPGDGCAAGVCLGSRLVSLAPGRSVTYALRESGGVAAWGSGPIGDGTLGPAPTAIAVDLGDVSRISQGRNHGCAVQRTGGVVCWGYNSRGQLGNGGAFAFDHRGPGAVTGISDATDVAVGEVHACAVRRTGEVMCWGANDDGQIGDGTSGASLSRLVPVPVMGIDDATQVMAFYRTSCALRVGGTVWCWGDNYGGGLGNGGGPSRATPVRVLDVDDAVAAGRGAGERTHTCVVRASGRVFCWGGSEYGEVGNGAGACVGFTAWSPAAMTGITGAVEVAMGTSTTCVRTSAGAVLCAGDNRVSQLGRVAATCSDRAEPVPGIADATGVAAGIGHACALESPRGMPQRVRCWGDNTYAALGNPAVAMPPTTMVPVAVVGLP